MKRKTDPEIRELEALYSLVMASSRSSKLVVWIVVLLFGCMAACAVLASVQPFSWFRTIVLSSIPSGYEERFTPFLYMKMVLGLRLMGVLLGVAAVVLARFRNRLTESLSVVWRDVVAVPREFAKAITLERNGIVHVGALVAIFIWAICLRLQFINEPNRKDEAWTFLAYASRPLLLGITYYPANNHLLNTLLMHLSTSVFGEPVWALRLPTLMAGILLVPVTYVAIRLYHGKIAAMLAAALVCASSPLIEFSFNARGYSLSALFGRGRTATVEPRPVAFTVERNSSVLSVVV